MLPIPYVIEQSSRGERSYDIFSRLLIDRIIMVSGPIESQMATAIITCTLTLLVEKLMPVWPSTTQ